MLIIEPKMVNIVWACSQIPLNTCLSGFHFRSKPNYIPLKYDVKIIVKFDLGTSTLL